MILKYIFINNNYKLVTVGLICYTDEHDIGIVVV